MKDDSWNDEEHITDGDEDGPERARRLGSSLTLVHLARAWNHERKEEKEKDAQQYRGSTCAQVLENSVFWLGPAIGWPHEMQFAAALEICFPHSGHLIKAIDFLPPPVTALTMYFSGIVEGSSGKWKVPFSSPPNPLQVFIASALSWAFHFLYFIFS